MNTTINILYVLIIFWLCAISGSEYYLKIGKDKQDGCRKISNKYGKTVVKLNSSHLLAFYLIAPIAGIIQGAILLMLQEGLYWIANNYLNVSLSTPINLANEYVISSIYGLIIGCGYYFGKSLAISFVAERLLESVRASKEIKHPMKPLSVQEAIE